MRKLSARWIPRQLTVDQKHTRQNMSRANRNRFETDPDNFLLRLWMKHGFVISSNNTNNSLNNGSAPAHTQRLFCHLGRLWLQYFGMLMVFLW